MAWLYRFIASVAVGFALVFVCYCECVANTRILARVDEWIPVCTGMTAGGADQFSNSGILTNVGIHCIASTVAWFYRFIASVAVGFALVFVCYCECVSKRGIRRLWMNGFPYARE
ncbi:hypothetical protein Q9X96_004025 [Vibrio vulnificus]|nr:hypothetical protein [Vibrio vulnificus]